MTAAGVWTYTLDNANSTVSALAASATTTDSFAVTAEDGTSQTVTVTITGANDAPVTVADTVTISEDDSAVVISVLDNDTDPENTTLTIAAKTDGSNGTVKDNGDGTVSYTPIANFNGTDTFQYRATDGTDQSELTTVTVTVTAVNDDPTGLLTITGEAKTGSTLTAVGSGIVDNDVVGDITYSWTGTKTGGEVRTSTGETLTLNDDDIGYVYTVVASYTDGGNTAESVAGATPTDEVANIPRPIILTAETIKASEAPDGAWALYPDEDIIKITVNLDMARMPVGLDDAVMGGTIYLDLDWDKIEPIEYNDDSTDAYVIESTSIVTIDVDQTPINPNFINNVVADKQNGVLNEIGFASMDVTLDPELTLVDDVVTDAKGQADFPSSANIGAFYINPVDDVVSFTLTYSANIDTYATDQVEQSTYTIDIL
jgi:hypothetical protein